MKTTAAILVELGRPLELVDLEIPALKPGQALVEIAYSGVCHTQVLEARGHRGEDRFLPHCLGHEGSGVVREVGPGVTRVKPGDRAILSWIKASGANVPGAVYQWGGRQVNAGAITTFQHHAVISENRLSPLPETISFRDGAMLGCALPTGFGVVINTLDARPRQSIAVFGTGGVGLCAVIGARIAGCTPVIAVDVVPERLKIAMQLGATHCINAGETDPLTEIQRICSGPLDLAVEASGQPQVMRQSLESVRAPGGATAIIGNAKHGEELSFNPQQLIGRRLLGSWGGEVEPDRDFPRLCQFMSAGDISVEPLISAQYDLEGINQALDDLEASKAIRPLVEMNLA